jgi:hypothetical protein
MKHPSAPMKRANEFINKKLLLPMGSVFTRRLLKGRQYISHLAAAKRCR